MLLVLLVAAAAFALGALVGCSKGEGVQEGLPSWIDEKAATEQTHEVVDLFVNEKYDELAKRFDKLDVSASDIQSAAAGLDGLGKFESYADAAFGHASSKDGELVVIVQMAKYENGTAQYTVSFAKNGTLAGFYVKKA